MTKKSISDLYSIAKDAIALVEYIKSNKLMLQDSSSKRLKEISEYIEKIKESADIQNIWENASGGATSAGSFASVIVGGPGKPIKRMDEYTNEPKLTAVDEKGRPIKKTNDAKLKKVNVKEDVGQINPVSPDEETALNNLRTVTKGKYTGTQVGSAINKAAGGGTLNQYDQKILDPIMQNLDTILQDPNSANQLKSAAQRATGVATAKNAATAQQQKQQQQKNGLGQNPNQPKTNQTSQPPTPINATPIGGTNMGTTGAIPSSNQLPTSGPNNQGLTKPSSNNTGNNAYGSVGTNGSNSMVGNNTNSNNTNLNQQTNNQPNQINTGSGQEPQTGFNTSESQLRSQMKQDISEWKLLKDFHKFKGTK